MILFTLFAALALSGAECSAQNSVAETDPLYQSFLDPPRDFSPMPFWFWNGKMEGPINLSPLFSYIDCRSTTLISHCV
jgi:hypothetical protein